MSRWISRNWLRAAALATVVMWCASICVPSAVAMPVLSGSGVPAVKMFGYAHGPVQQIGSAAGKPHYVPASATRVRQAAAGIKGHAAPMPQLAPPAVGTRIPVTVGSVKMPPGHEVNHHLDVSPGEPVSLGAVLTTGEPVSDAVAHPLRIQYGHNDQPGCQQRHRQRDIQCRVGV